MGCVHCKCCGDYIPPSSDCGGADSCRGIAPRRRQRKYKFSPGSLKFAHVPSHNYVLEYSFLTQQGYYPDSPDKENQDTFCIRTQVQGDPNVHFFGVFDGHGQCGSQCSNFVRDKLIETLSNDPALLEDPVKAYTSAFLATNYQLHSSEIDDSMSGTTAITVLVVGDTLYVANVGDSRAVLGVKDGNYVVAENLSSDQTPFRSDEYERVKLCGARVLSVDQVEGIKDPDVQTWGDEESQGNNPPRLWVPNGMYPGTAFTRSLGDSLAETIGVIATPEVSVVQITSDHLFFIVASDGIFEFLSSQTVVNMAASYTDPGEACAAIAGEAYKQWLEHENRTDDITIIIVRIRGSNAGTSGVRLENSNINTATRMRRGTSDASAATSSDVYCSVRSETSDQQCGQNTDSMRSPSIVPSPSYQRAIE